MASAPTLHPPPEPPAGATASVHVADGGDASRRQLRGSTLLLAGRMLSLAVNFVTQVLIVRYLSKNDFGIFAYGLSMVALGEALCTIGLDKGIARFLPIYDERGQYGKLFGTLFMAGGTVVGLGLAFILVAFGLNGFAGGEWRTTRTPITVLLDHHLPVAAAGARRRLMGAFAVFGKPRAIFFRKYVLAPGLRLAAIGAGHPPRRGVAGARRRLRHRRRRSGSSLYVVMLGSPRSRPTACCRT